MKPLRLLIAVAALGIAGAAAVRAADAPPAEKPATDPVAADRALAVNLISAIEASDFASFVAPGDPAFQQMPRQTFDEMVGPLQPRFKAGYQMTYLTELRKHGFHVTLWKLSFKDGRDDALATLAREANGQVAAFFVQ